MMFRPNPRVIYYLSLVFSATICNAMIISFMSYFIIQELAQEPKILGIYGGLIAIYTIFVSRKIGKQLDKGQRPFPIVGVQVGAFLIAISALLLAPSVTTLFFVGLWGFGLSSTTISTLFSSGNALFPDLSQDHGRMNSYLRATTSGAWMIGPALSFQVAEIYDAAMVFRIAGALALIWIILWISILPRDFRIIKKQSSTITSTTPPTSETSQTNSKILLWAAGAFVFSISFAHSMTFMAIPVLYISDVGLPVSAPGQALSIKTFIEIFAILSTPFILKYIGIYRGLFIVAFVAILANLLIAHVNSLWDMVIAAAIEGLYYGFYAGLAMHFTQILGKNRPATAMATYWNMLTFSRLLATSAGSMIAQYSDFQTVIYVSVGVDMIAFIIMGGLLFFRLEEKPTTVLEK